MINKESVVTYNEENQNEKAETQNEGMAIDEGKYDTKERREVYESQNFIYEQTDSLVESNLNIGQIEQNKELYESMGVYVNPEDIILKNYGSSRRRKSTMALDVTRPVLLTERKMSLPEYIYSLSSNAAPVDLNIFYMQNRIGVDWDLDLFRLDSITNGKALVHLGVHLFRPFQSLLNCKEEVTAFLCCVADLYKDNPYHHSIHAADVTHNVLWLSRYMNIYSTLDCVEQLAIIVAALCHDLGHPGTNNEFHIKTNSELCQRYHGLSILENYHLELLEKTLSNSENNFLKNLSDEDVSRLKQIIKDQILITDMSQHFNFIKAYAERLQSAEFNVFTQSDKNLVLRLIMKAADIGHCCKQWHYHQKICISVLNEFLKQGDLERSIGVKISPLCDRATLNIPESQSQFLKFVCIDLYRLIVATHNKINEQYIRRFSDESQEGRIETGDGLK